MDEKVLKELAECSSAKMRTNLVKIRQRNELYQSYLKEEFKFPNFHVVIEIEYPDKDTLILFDGCVDEHFAKGVWNKKLYEQVVTGNFGPITASIKESDSDGLKYIEVFNAQDWIMSMTLAAIEEPN